MRPTKISIYSLFAFLALLTVSVPNASAVVFGADASVWDSTVATDIPNGIYPIGGSGQINGEFVIETVEDTDTAMQIGLRAQERFAGPTLPRSDDMYFSDTGESTPGNALWNYDFHLDFGTSFLGTDLGKTLTPQDMRDFDVEFALDTDPSPATSFVATDLNAAYTAVGVGATDPIVLAQSSQNIGFAVLGGPLDPNVPGIYDFRLTVSDPATSDVIAQVSMQVKVGQPIGGEIIPIESAALLLAGVQTSTVWILPAVVAGASILAYKLRRN